MPALSAIIVIPGANPGRQPPLPVRHFINGADDPGDASD
jgi:hypothetical protein